MGWGCLFCVCGVALFAFGLDVVGWPLFLLGGLVMWANRREARA